MRFSGPSTVVGTRMTESFSVPALTINYRGYALLRDLVGGRIERGDIPKGWITTIVEKRRWERPDSDRAEKAKRSKVR